MRSSILKLTLLIAAFLLPTSMNALAESDNALAELDEYIEKKEAFDNQKRQRINGYIKQAEKTADNKKKYDLYMKVADEYTLFKSDSAIIFYNKAYDTAMAAGNEGDAIYARIKKVRPEMIAGFYAEAQDEFRVIETMQIPEEILSDYYECGYRLYSFSLNSLEEGSSFYEKYNDNTIRFRKKWVSSLPEESDLRRLYEAEQLINDGNANKAKIILTDLIASLKSESNDYALACAFMSKIYKLQGNRRECIHYLALSAISDIQSSVKENQSIYELSIMLFEDRQIDKAYKYIFESLKDAAFCSAQMRVYKASGTIPIIESAQRKEMEAHDRMLMTYVMVSVFLLLGLGLTVFLLMKQMRKLSDTRRKLKDANMTKDEYMGQFLELCSIYMKRLDSFTKLVSRKLTSGQTEDLMKMIKSQKFSDEQHGTFYKEFDNAFLKIYTTFIDDVNALLREDQRIDIEEPGRLNTELRIYALMRLGIDDSSKIAEFLRYSVNTIYAYRNKMKNKAADRENFEETVMKIGVID